MELDFGSFPIIVCCATIASAISLTEIGMAVINARRGFRRSFSGATVGFSALVVISCLYNLTQV